MEISTASLDLGSADYLASAGAVRGYEVFPAAIRPAVRPDPEQLRRCAWEIGTRRPAECYTPPTSHVGLAMVHPGEGFAYWRILPNWMEQLASSRGPDWDGSRPILRVYDVSYIHFTGLNAHRIQDHPLPDLMGQLFFSLSMPGTYQIAEVGFLL